MRGAQKYAIFRIPYDNIGFGRWFHGAWARKGNCSDIHRLGCCRRALPRFVRTYELSRNRFAACSAGCGSLFRNTACHAQSQPQLAAGCSGCTTHNVDRISIRLGYAKWDAKSLLGNDPVADGCCVDFIASRQCAALSSTSLLGAISLVVLLGAQISDRRPAT